MADTNNNKLLVVLDKYQDRVDKLVVATAVAKNVKSAESSKDTMDMKTFISKEFSPKMFVNIFDGDSEEWLWKTNPKISHIHARCVELWGSQPEVNPEEDIEEPEVEEPVEESVEDESLECESESDEEPVEESVEDESLECESESDDEPKVEEESEPEESKSSKLSEADSATAKRKSSKTSKSTKKNTSKKAKPSNKESEPEDKEVNEDITKKSGGILVWIIAGIAIVILAISTYLALKPGKELSVLGLTAQYTEATTQFNEEVKPAWYRWESWDREVAAKATLAWGPYFRALYIEGDGCNPTANSIQLYAVYLTLDTMVSQGLEPGEALRVIREDGSEAIVAALKSGNISSKDISFIREYLMK